MNDTTTIMIFQKPQLYFFPHFKGRIFSPFCIPEKSFRYLLYKALYILHIPLCSIFWGEWKHHLRQARQVIIFDYGYQRGMETYIHRINPDCQVSLFFWNIIDKQRKNHRLFTDKNAIYSTDRGDCKTYGFHYNHMFYPKDYFTPYDPAHKDNLFFIGHDKGRGPYLLSLYEMLEKSGISCDIRLLSSSKDSSYRSRLSKILTDQELSYEEYCKMLQKCGILLDINQEGQSALTMRVMEAVYFSKKLITNNQDITRYPFYNENNIFLLPKDQSLPSGEALADFLHKPFVPYPEAVLEEFDYEHWRKGFLR